MEEIVQILNTSEECDLVAKIFSNLARTARLRSIELRAKSHGKINLVEYELYKALYAYEDVLTEKHDRKTRASRTWQMVNRYGIIEAAEKAVNRKIDPLGFIILSRLGLEHLTFEAVIVRYLGSFKPEIVEIARLRLAKLEDLKFTLEGKVLSHFWRISHDCRIRVQTFALTSSGLFTSCFMT